MCKEQCFVERVKREKANASVAEFGCRESNGKWRIALRQDQKRSVRTQRNTPIHLSFDSDNSGLKLSRERARPSSRERTHIFRDHHIKARIVKVFRRILTWSLRDPLLSPHRGLRCGLRSGLMLGNWIVTYIGMCAPFLQNNLLASASYRRRYKNVHQLSSSCILYMQFRTRCTRRGEALLVVW